MFAEFRKFMMRGNVIDLAVGIIMGAAFTAIVNSMVNDIIMPPIGAAIGGTDFSNLFIVLNVGEAASRDAITSLAVAEEFGAATLKYGQFINEIINFLLVGLAVFFLVRTVNNIQDRYTREEAAEDAPPAEPTTEQKLLEAVESLTQAIERKL